MLYEVMTHTLVEPFEPDLVDALEHPTADPGARDHGQREQRERKRVIAEYEARDPEDRDLREVTCGLAGGLRPDQCLAGEADLV